jgi:hypothetical protein
MKTLAFSHSLEKGWENRPSPALAGSEWDSPETVVLAFCAPAYRDQPSVIAELRGLFPNAQLLGCSTSGEIHGDQIRDRSMAVLVFRFERASIRVARAKLAGPGDSEDVGGRIASELRRPGLRGIFALSDGLLVNGSALMKGINAALGDTPVPVSGGLAGDLNLFKSTWLITESGTTEPGWVAAIGFYGETVDLRQSSQGGWDIFGPERTVTRSRGNILYEIDGRPALDLYKEYLGEKAGELPASGLLFPLQIRRNEGDERRLVRTVLAVDEESRSVTFAGDVPEGVFAQFMRANFERVIDAAGRAGEVASKGGAEPRLVLAVSCVGRRLALGARAEEEVEALREALPPAALLAGFYSYGELGATVSGRPCDLHNQTMTILTLGEK